VQPLPFFIVATYFLHIWIKQIENLFRRFARHLDSKFTVILGRRLLITETS